MINGYFSKCRKFTMIELLVILSVISFMVSILIPALQLVRKKAMAITCEKNLEQIGLGWALYFGDNNGKIPQNIGYWGAGGFDTGRIAPWAKNADVTQRPLYNYVPDDLYKCPSDNSPRAIPTSSEVWKDTGTSYTFNQYINSSNASVAAHAVNHVGNIRGASKTILMGDATMYLFVQSSWPGSMGRFTWHDPEGLNSNILFADLHVGLTDIYEPTLGSTPEYKWYGDVLDNN